MTEIIFGPPGTGKTTTLLGEVEKELGRGTSPDRIGFITFTTKGANEAIERACKQFSFTKEQLPFFRTIHSLCYRSLGLRSANVLAGSAFNEFANYAGIEVTGRAWSDDGLLSSFKRGDRILFMENLARIRQVTLREQYSMNPDGLPWNEVDRVARALTTFKSSRGLLDYTDMLTEFVNHDRDVGVSKLFVDEAQDLSSLQWKVVELLSRSADRVVVAGDDDQAIYKWAGADVDHLIDMDGDARVLGKSYRCPPVVQKLANSIISKVAHRKAKKWAAKPGGSGLIERRRSFSDVEIAPDGTVLVLARNAYVIREQIEPALRRAGVLYERNGVSSLKPAIMQAVFAWEDLRKGEAVTLGEARHMYAYIAPLTGVKRGHKTLKNYGEDEDVPVSMSDLLQTGGLLRDPNLPWHDALDKLPQDDMSYILAARRRGEKVRGGRPRVRVSTIHSAKGGQADHVVLMKEMAVRTFQEMALRPDDERRVWYVGATRARERLTMVSGETSRECPWI